MNRDHARAVAVFPGQLSQDVSVRELLEEWNPQLLETLSTALGHDDPIAEAHDSLAAQQAVTVGCSLAAWHAQGRPTPRYLLGHSLGELTALAAARSISEDDAVRLAAIRGELLQRACEAAAGSGMMAVRAPHFDIEAIADECDVVVALHTAPRQLVVAGTRDALGRARAALSEAGIRCTELDQPGAFNSPLMEPAVAPFGAALAECEVQPPQAIVYSASTCRPLIDVRAELAHNLVAPVRWWETLARLAMQGVDTFLEITGAGLLSTLPAGIVTERAPRPSEADGATDTVVAYSDEQDRLHVLV